MITAVPGFIWLETFGDWFHIDSSGVDMQPMCAEVSRDGPITSFLPLAPLVMSALRPNHTCAQRLACQCCSLSPHTVKQHLLV